MAYKFATLLLNLRNILFYSLQISEEEGREFLDEVQYDLREIRLRYEPEIIPVAKPINQETKSLIGQKTHQGEIVVTSYRDTNNKSVDDHQLAQVCMC